MSASRLLLFDIDGTLLTCRGRGMRAMHRVVEALWGFGPVEIRVQPQGKTDPMLFEEVGAAYGLTPAAIEVRRAELGRVYLERLAEELQDPTACEIKPGILELLDALARRTHVALGIVSGNLEGAAWLKLETCGLERFFAAGAFGSDGRQRADLVRLAMQRFARRTGREFQARDVWVIGDTPDDVSAGRAHGTRTLGVATGSFSRADLERAGAEVVRDDFRHSADVVDMLCAEA